MKSILKYFLIAIIATTIIPLAACKKGAKDPFLSFSSRTKRLTGDWKMSNASVTTVKVQGNITTTTVFTFDGTEMTEETTTKIGAAAPTTTTSKYPVTELLSIMKDNTYKLTYTEPGYTPIDEGTWAFLHKDEAAELKNKEAVVFYRTKRTIGASSSTFGQTDIATTIVLEMLKKDEMIITINEEDNSGATDVTTTKGTKTYVQ